jgi:hypothetical protein
MDAIGFLYVSLGSSTIELHDISKCYTSSNHPVVQLPEELSILVDNPGRGEHEQPLIGEYYKEATPLCHLIQSGNCPPTFNYTYESLFFETRVSFDEGRQIEEAEDHNEEFKKFARKNENQQMFRHGRLRNGGQNIHEIRIDTYK